MQHHTTQDRTLYPRIVSARGHFLFTSHLDTPMRAWDIRCTCPLQSLCRCLLLLQTRTGAMCALCCAPAARLEDIFYCVGGQKYEQASL